MVQGSEYEVLIPFVLDWDDACFILCDLLEDGLREIKVVPGRIAPPSIVVGKRVVWRAEVSGGNDDRTLEAPLPARAFDLEARTAALPVVEQSRAQCSALGAIPLVVEITITTCPSCDKDRRSNTMSGRLDELWRIAGEVEAYPSSQKHHHLHRR